MSGTSANASRGEAWLLNWALRPSFDALVAAEEELGPLFALVERAASGQLKLSEMVTLFWHCLKERGDLSREGFGELIAEAGLAAVTPALKALLGQILAGR
jgi:hypothetical protein